MAACFLGEQYPYKKKKKEREGGVFIHSNSTRFVMLLLSICHHKSHFDLVFFGAALPAQFCLLILHRTPREFGGSVKNTQGKKRKQRPLFTERERRQSLQGLPLREEHETANKDIKHAECLPVTAPSCVATLPGRHYHRPRFTGGDLDTETVKQLPKLTQIVDFGAWAVWLQEPDPNHPRDLLRQ